MSETNPNPPPGTIDVLVDPASPTASNAFGHSSSTPAADAPQAPYRLRGPRRRWTIIFGITTTALITALSLTLLYFKWYRTVDYNAMIIVQGEPALDGAIASVSGPALGTNELSERLSEPRNYMIRFHVPPGLYRVVIRSPDGKSVLAVEIMKDELKPNHLSIVKFPRWSATTRPGLSTGNP